MNKTILREKVSTIMGIPRSEAVVTVDVVLGSIVNALIKGEAVRLPGFGSLTVVDKPQREGRNIRTGEPVTIPAHKVVRFKASKEFSQRLNK